MDDEYDVDLGALDWTVAGVCPCSLELPPMREWNDAGGTWPWYVCACGRYYVDDEEFISIYPQPPDPDDIPDLEQLVAEREGRRDG